LSTDQLQEQPNGERRPEEIKAVPVRHYGRWVFAAVLVVVAVKVTLWAINDTNFHWHVVGQYLFDTRVLKGVLATLELTVLAMLIGIVLGVVLAVMRQSPNPLVAGASWLYVWFFRGTPLLVQILFWYAIATLYKPTFIIPLGIPFGPVLIHAHANQLVTPLVAALLGLGLNEGAYMAEIVRAGLLSVDEGQTEAAQSIGMRRIQILRAVVLPQAMRVIIPPTGNETISMLKNTSLVSVAAYTELLYSVQLIYSVNYETVALLIVASIWYLAMTSILYVIQYFIERRFGRGFTRAEQATMRARILRFRHGDESGGAA
jgi:polar amino acid transport system permease protein